MGYADGYFNRAPAPRMGKPPHVWTGVRARPANEIPHGDEKLRYLFRCPAPLCFYNVTATTEKDAERHQHDHPCPWFGGGTTTLSWSIMSDSFLIHIWKMLDEQVDIIMGGYDPSWDDDRCRMENERARYEARGIAKTLAVLMPPFFHHPDEIAKEAKGRYTARSAGRDYETPGIGRLRMLPPASTLGMLNENKPVSSAKAAVTATASKLGDKERAAIKNALSVPGMFSEEDLAKVYGVSVAVIKQVAGA